MDRCVKLTIHGNLVPELGMRGDIPLLLAAFIRSYLVKHGDRFPAIAIKLQGGSNMTGADLYVNKLHCAAAVRH